jgi:hypothetical protein
MDLPVPCSTGPRQLGRLFALPSSCCFGLVIAPLRAHDSDGPSWLLPPLRVYEFQCYDIQKNWGDADDKQTVDCSCWAMLLANTPGAVADTILFGGIGGHNISAGPEASANDGSLAIVVTRPPSRLSVIPLMSIVFQGWPLTPQALFSQPHSRRVAFRRLRVRRGPATCFVSIRPPAR